MPLKDELMPETASVIADSHDVGDQGKMIIYIDSGAGAYAYAPKGTTSIESRGEVEVCIGEEADRTPINEVVAEVGIDAQGSAAAEQQTQGCTDGHLLIETVTDLRSHSENGTIIADSQKLNAATCV